MSSRIAYTKQTTDGRTITFRFVASSPSIAHVQPAVDGVDNGGPESRIVTMPPVQGYTRRCGMIVLDSEQATGLQAALDAETARLRAAYAHSPEGLADQRRRLVWAIGDALDTGDVEFERRHAREDATAWNAKRDGENAADRARAALADFDAAHPEIAEIAARDAEAGRQAAHDEARRLIAAGI